MTGLRPFFTYFGGKWRAAPKYPPPLQRKIVEPFAGSAGYALRYPDRGVLLVEKNPEIAALWRYLVAVSPAEIRALPDLVIGGSVRDLPGLIPEQRSLIGLWANQGAARPRNIMTEWGAKCWTPRLRSILASQVERIRHWQVICGDFSEAPDWEATWFIDPPYEGMGRHYPCGADGLDFPALAEWCRSRRGQVLVCENSGAGWLPFASFGAFRSNQALTRRRSPLDERLARLSPVATGAQP